MLNEELLQSTMRILHDKEMHSVAKANALRDFSHHHSNKFAERKLAAYFNISKTEVNRLLTLATLPTEIKLKALQYNTEKYVLLKLAALMRQSLENPNHLYHGILTGQITTMRQVRLGLEKKNRFLN